MVLRQVSHTKRSLPPIFTLLPLRTGIIFEHMKHLLSLLSNVTSSLHWSQWSL